VTIKNIKSICVYCGSSSGRLEAYSNAARALAQELVSRKISLVYGGASIGIMGLLADTVLELGGRAVGVMPESLVRKEIAHKNLTELHVTQSMHERKSIMSDLSDGFIAMPGGLGTLEEIFEILTWSQLGFHGKPCGLLNVEGYFDSLTEFLDHSVKERFIKQVHRQMLIVESDPKVLLDRFSSYFPPVVEKWVREGQT
jgi:uncharacterized protein (TIGR00730 family)